nr:hypothetical protein [Treponema sp.]
MMYCTLLFYKKTSFLDKILFLLMYLQIIFLFFANTTQVKFHLGYDAASCFIKANEIFKQGTLFIKNYGDQSGPFFDYVVPFAALLKNIVPDVFVSYGLISFVVDICIILVIFKILSLSKLQLSNILIVLNLILCPFVPVTFNNANDLSYINVLLVAPSYYSVRVLFGILPVYMYLRLKSNTNKMFSKKELSICILSLFGLFTASISSGYYLLVSILLPILFYSIFEIFYKNTVNNFFSKKNIYILTCIFISIFGKFCNSHLLRFNVIDSDMKMISLSDFFTNLQNILLGYFELLVALTPFSDTRILGKAGIWYLIGLFMALFLLFILLKVFLQNLRKNDESLVFIFIITVNIFVYTFTNSRYGAQFFEIRYLVLPVLFLFCLIPFFLKSIPDNLLLKRTIIFFMVAFTSIETVLGDYKYFSTKNNFSEMQKIEILANSYDEPIIYIYKNRILARNMAAYDTKKFYRGVEFVNENLTLDFWGDYKYLSKVADYSNSILLYIPEDFQDDLKEVPVQYRNYLSKISDRIYKSDFNIFAVDAFLKKELTFFQDNLFSTNSTDFQGIRTIHPQGFSFGPYWNVPAGDYCVAIKGDNLTSAFIDVYHKSGVAHDSFSKDVTDTAITLNLHLEEDASDLEFFIRNDSRSDIQLESIILKNTMSLD